MDDRRVGRSPSRELAAISRRSALRRLGAAGVATGTGLGMTQHAANAQISFATAATEAAARRAVSAI
ncbi:MAG: hypothetical protein K0Q71_2186, partial [Thermomicrobiales bacterium]|nr:hypothetical protein [Thermomicrobiales bacterium]